MFHVEHPGPRAGRGRAPRRRRTPAARPGDVSMPLRLPLTIALNIPGASADPSVGAPGFSVCRPVACGTCRPPAGRSLLSLPARGPTLPAGGLGFSPCRQQEASYSRQAAPIFVPAARPELCAARLAPRAVLPPASSSHPGHPVRPRAGERAAPPAGYPARNRARLFVRYAAPPSRPVFVVAAGKRPRTPGKRPRIFSLPSVPWCAPPG